MGEGLGLSSAPGQRRTHGARAGTSGVPRGTKPGRYAARKPKRVILAESTRVSSWASGQGRTSTERSSGSGRGPGVPVSLAQLTVSNLRSIEHAELDVSPGLTLIWGDNGSGKTSLLEAIFLLGRGRSFRTRNNERLIQRGKDHLRVIGRIRDADSQTSVLGFEASQTATTARIAGRPAQSLAELSNAFPVQVIDPGV